MVLISLTRTSLKQKLLRHFRYILQLTRFIKSTILISVLIVSYFIMKLQEKIEVLLLFIL